MQSRNIFEITADNFQTDVLDAALPVLVDFTADWCPPCKMLAPIVDAIAGAYTDKMRVGSIDVDVYPELQQQYGVMGLPTLILFQGGVPVKRIIGYQPRQKIEGQITAHLTTTEA